MRAAPTLPPGVRRELDSEIEEDSVRSIRQLVVTSATLVIVCIASAIGPATMASANTVPPQVNATTWSQTMADAGPGGSSNNFNSVSCTSAACFAVGNLGAIFDGVPMLVIEQHS